MCCEASMPSRSRLNNCQTIECFFTLYNAPDQHYLTSKTTDHTQQRSKRFRIYHPSLARTFQPQYYGKKQINLANRISHFFNPKKAASNLKILRANVQYQLAEKKTILKYYKDPRSRYSVKLTNNSPSTQYLDSYPGSQSNQTTSWSQTESFTNENSHQKDENSRAEPFDFSFFHRCNSLCATKCCVQDSAMSIERTKRSYETSFFPTESNEPCPSYGQPYFKSCLFECKKKFCLKSTRSPHAKARSQTRYHHHPIIHRVTDHIRLYPSPLLLHARNNLAYYQQQPLYYSSPPPIYKNFPSQNYRNPCNDSVTCFQSQHASSRYSIHSSSNTSERPTLFLKAQNSGLTRNLNQYPQKSGLLENLIQYPQNSGFARTLNQYPQNSGLTENLNQYPQNTAVTGNLNQYPQNSGLTENLNQNQQNSGFTRTLNQYPQKSGLTENLDQYPQNNGLTGNLNHYQQNSGLKRNLDQYPTSTFKTRSVDTLTDPYISPEVKINYEKLFAKSLTNPNPLNTLNQSQSNDFAFIHKCNSLCAKKCCVQDMSSIKAFYESGIRNIRSFPIPSLTETRCPNFGKPYFISCRFKCQNKFCKRSASFLYASQNEKRSVLRKNPPMMSELISSPTSKNQINNVHSQSSQKLKTSEKGPSENLLNLFFDKYNGPEKPHKSSIFPHKSLLDPSLFSNTSSSQPDEQNPSVGSSLATLLKQLANDSPIIDTSSIRLTQSNLANNSKASINFQPTPLAKRNNTAQSDLKTVKNRGSSLTASKQQDINSQLKSQISVPIQTTTYSSHSVSSLQPVVHSTNYPEPVIPKHPQLSSQNNQVVPLNLQSTSLSPQYIQSFSRFAQNPQPTSTQDVKTPSMPLIQNQHFGQSMHYLPVSPQYHVYAPPYSPLSQVQTAPHSLAPYATPLYSTVYPNSGCQEKPKIVMPSSSCSFTSSLHLGFFSPHPEIQAMNDQQEYELYDPGSDNGDNSPGFNDNSDYEIVDASSLGISPQSLGVLPESIESSLTAKDVDSNSEEKFVEVPLDLNTNDVADKKVSEFHHHHPKIRIHITNHQDTPKNGTSDD